MGKIEIQALKNPPVFRKIAMGSWRTVGDPSVYALLEIDCQKALEFAESYGSQHGIKVSPSHLVGRAVVQSIKARPEINGFLRGSRIYLRKHIDLFFQVNVPGEGDDKVKKANLSGMTVRHIEGSTLKDFVDEFTRKTDVARRKDDPTFSKTFQMFKWIPWSLSGFVLNFVSWLNYGLNLNFKWLGIPSDPFGSVMITNIGSLGIDLAWAPLVPYSRVPLLLALGAIKKKPIVIDDKVEARSVMTIAVTFDHRFIDGIHAAQMAQVFKKCFEDPERYLA